MRADERGRPSVRRPSHGTLPVAETEQEVLLAINQRVEGEHIGGGGVAVGELQRDPDAGADRGGGEVTQRADADVVGQPGNRGVRDKTVDRHDVLPNDQYFKVEMIVGQES